MCMQGPATFRLEVPEELLSPRSRLAANAARRLAQGVTNALQGLGTTLGDFAGFLAGRSACSQMIVCCACSLLVSGLIDSSWKGPDIKLLLNSQIGL